MMQDNIHLALQQIQTISSSTVVRLVREAVHSAPTRSSKHRTRLTELLHCILALPTPSPTYRLDLRKSLPVEDAAMVLEELTTWAEMHVERRLDGLSSWAPEEGAEMKMPRPVTPSLESVGLTFCLSRWD